MDDSQDEQPEDQGEEALRFLYKAGHTEVGYHSGATIFARGLWALGLLLVDIRSTLRSIEHESRRR